MRVLHIIGSLNRGGTETWLVSLFREVAQTGELHNEVLVQTPAGPEGYEGEMSALNIPVSSLPRNLLWPLKLFRFMRKQPQIDIVHSHRDEFSAVVLLIAWLARIPRRIAHNHNDHRIGETRLHRMYRQLAGGLIQLVATDRIAVSEGAQDALYSRHPGESSILYCGIDIGSNRFDPAARQRVRAELGIADHVTVLIHVGGLRAQKNHQHLLRCFSEFLKNYQSDSQLLLVGTGPLHEELRRQVEALGIGNSVHFLGVRSDVPAILSAGDLFVFPSVFEGLGLAVVEAQAAGLPVVLSDSISREAIVLPDLVTTVKLEAAPSEWAAAFSEVCRSRRDREIDLALFDRFDIRTNARFIRQLYGLEKQGPALRRQMQPS